MSAEPDALLDAALLVADGAAPASIDWDALASGSGEREAALRLRALAEIAAACDALQSGADADEVVATLAGNATPPHGAAGDTWGPLRLVERLGAGAFGAVYRAYDARLDRHVALKLLAPGAGAGGAVIHEGRLLARVRHPHVVTVHGADEHDGRTGVWMDLIDGETLAERVRRHGPVAAGEAALIGIDLCGALAALHAAGLVHRDVKAQNVMRETGGRIVLMDLGAGLDLARAVPGIDQGLSGTPLYMAPEMFRGAAATPRSDLYALGVLLFHLVTGRYPVAGASVAEVIAAHAAARPLRLRDLRPDLPAPFIEAVEHALAADPRERTASAGAFDAALRRAITPQPEAPAKRGFWINFKLGPLQLSLGAALVLALAVAGLAQWNGPARGPGAGLGTPAAALVRPTPPLNGTVAGGLSVTRDGASVRVTTTRAAYVYVVAQLADGTLVARRSPSSPTPANEPVATALGAGARRAIVVASTAPWDGLARLAAGERAADAALAAWQGDARAHAAQFDLTVLDVH